MSKRSGSVDEENLAPLAKRSRMPDDIDENLLRMVEQHGQDDVLDASAVRRLILAFEKRSLKNQEMRIKFPDNPEKFMESELELHTGLEELHAIATVPELYPLVVNLNAVTSLLGLLTHENSDIAIAVIDLIQELTDVDALTESEEGAQELIDTLVDGQVIALLVQNLQRLDETIKEDSDGVHNALGVIENMTEFRPELAKLATEQGLLAWILQRLRATRGFDANKLYASEVLAILLQNEKANRLCVGELNGIDALLQSVSYYKRRDPQSSEETELMENLFDCLCLSLMTKENREKFLEGEGLQLMIIMLREKKSSRNGALKVLNHALTGVEGASNCNAFIEIGGLGSFFPHFMKTPKKSKKGLSESEYEEHVCAIVASLIKNATVANRTRLFQKFEENDCLKVERLMELNFKYSTKVRQVDDDNLDENRAAEEADELYLRKLDSGLFVLQLVSYIIGEVCVQGPPSANQRVRTILNQKKMPIEDIKKILTEYAENVGDPENEEERETEKNRILTLTAQL
ncbi:beta-catenin-like protein 1 [Oscarella lobularis]|uniref:beta-catenin-like protein 1 n=1 Tax=Oscarella lobularis TaxID=121494 RepID=UPI0033137847